MGQKANPIGQRLGLIKGWDSNWYGGDNYADKLVEDEKIRQYLMARLKKASVSRIIIERTLKLVTVTINTARPGVIIGRGGSEVDKLREELKKFTGKDVQINIFEIKRPELDARLVADSIARQLEGRISFRRAMKMSVASTMRMGAEGIKVQVSGRLNGAEIARTEKYREGRVPLHTLRADIDFAITEAHTKMGRIGVKCWIMRGEVYGKRDLSPNQGQVKGPGGMRMGPGNDRRGGERRGPGGPGGGERRGGGGERRGPGGPGGERRGPGGPGGERRGPGGNRGGNRPNN
ncbi:MAG: 30S ribosomal protein S3 [Flavobacteriales bacterium]|jgi:small subunit ribosomal protein S3|nr:30S ribosomal protein S3 [Flavobacteriales bacterium]MBK7246717.1 30S ribosomal protein S3 [Flavobacteriales bacterium]MBK9060971.1 30S ribosomal protein S3 [Flavobacteriales bacterium]MBK9598681.1 30S ribosomal protein S3 [Flavobacteriales bacterium]QQS72392.1 MAG: 30S ribosomal protein S3 [Flavobacteriales bacterium]